MKQSSFDATISALDAEMSAITWRSFDATISVLDVVMWRRRSTMRRRRRSRGVTSDIGAEFPTISVIAELL